MIRATTRLGLFLLAVVLLPLAQTQAMPQSARQALIEMFFSKTPGTLEKHLPEATRAAVRQASTGSAASAFNTFSMIASQIQAQGGELQTFDTGPTLLTFEDPRQHSKIEVIVERDDLQAGADEIEVSFRAYKGGQSQTGGVTPRLAFSMKQEKGTWRLNEVAVTVKVSLADPALLKAMTTPITPTINPVSQEQGFQPGSTGWHGGGSGASEASAIASLRTLATAEITYASTYPSAGFTCSLSDLGGMGGSERNQHQAMLVDPRLSSGRKNGYVFAFTGCAGSPAARFSATAVPAEPSAGLRAFCSDESGTIRVSANGNAVSCLASGRPLQ